MFEKHRGHTNQPYVTGHDGRPVTLDSLPPANTSRWVASRKAVVVAAVEGGLISLDTALERYGLSEEEYIAWRRALIRHGSRALCVGRTQQYREAPRG